MSHDVFISYSTHDKASADATCAALEASGVRCWIAPRDITPGAEWGGAIIDAIQNSRVLILIFSAHANDSPQIRREVERAVSKGIPVIPLRIEDIAPTHSLEFFIGTVHWLDALTPPLESHLRRVVESVKALLQIDPAPPRIVPRNIDPISPAASWMTRPLLTIIVLACLGLAAMGVWWFAAARAPRSETALPAPTPVQVPSQTAKAAVEPAHSGMQPEVASSAAPLAQAPTPTPKALVETALIGTFEYETVVDDFDRRSVISIAADGTYRLFMTQEETGTFQGGNGFYRTLANKTGRVRTGTYRAVGSAAIEVTSATGTAVFQPAQPIAPLDQANPAMLGTWRATTVQGGLTWTLTAENNLNGTYDDLAQAEDNGSCTFANERWRTTSAVTGQSNAGTYRVLDANDIEVTSPQGPAIWRRQ